MVRDITDNEFDTAVAEGVSLVDFWAPWCPPCRMQSPVIDSLADKMGDVDFYKMNVDDEKEIPTRFQVRSIPTLLITKDGEVVDTLVGYHDEATLQQELEKHL